MNGAQSSKSVGFSGFGIKQDSSLGLRLLFFSQSLLMVQFYSEEGLCSSAAITMLKERDGERGAVGCRAWLAFLTSELGLALQAGAVTCGTPAAGRVLCTLSPSRVGNN